MESTGRVHPEPFRIALITDGLFPLSIGGMQKHSSRLAAHLAEAGAEVLLYHPHRDLRPEGIFSSKQQQSIRCIYVPWPRVPTFPGHYLWSNYCYSSAVHRLLLQEEKSIDAVYVQGFSGWRTLCVKKKSCPAVLNLHGMEMFQPLRGLKNKLNGLLLRLPARLLLRKADAVVSLGGKLTEIIRRQGVNSQILAQPVGIDAFWLEQNAGQNQGAERKVLFVGRYEWRKGLDLLNSVIPGIIEDFKGKVSFGFIGDIPSTHRVTNQDVHYYGALRDENQIRAIYRSSDILVCPSYSEGMPTVILEAMASGLSVLATNVGAVSLLVSQANGRLIEPGDEYSLRKAMEEMIQCPEDEMQHMKRSSKQKATAFNWTEVARLCLEHLQKLKAKHS